MRLDPEEARQRFGSARVARFATVGDGEVPHLVPVTFALDGHSIVFGIDHKPKASMNLRRLRNIAANPNVSFLVDHYDDDWARLWWVRADGMAAVVDDEAERARLAGMLRAKYVQYTCRPPEGPLVRTTVSTWRGWTAS